MISVVASDVVSVEASVVTSESFGDSVVSSDVSSEETSSSVVVFPSSSVEDSVLISSDVYTVDSTDESDPSALTSSEEGVRDRTIATARAKDRAFFERKMNFFMNSFFSFN